MELKQVKKQINSALKLILQKVLDHYNIGITHRWLKLDFLQQNFLECVSDVTFSLRKNR